VGPDGERHGSGGAPHTTNQRMEVQAVLEALRALEGPVVIVSDSTYVVNCFRDRWYVKWQKNGWKNSKKEPVANLDLWKPLIDLVLERRPEFRWVKGHSGNRMNDLVDRLAVAAAQSPFAADRDETPFHAPMEPPIHPAAQDRLFEV
jgi:ribonuclease HI